MYLRLDRAAEHALARLAIRERRLPRAQAEHIVISELERRGLFVPPADAIGGDVSERVAADRVSARELRVMEHSDDRSRAGVESPTARILRRVNGGQRISADEKRHLQAWVAGKRRTDPSNAGWIKTDLQIRALKTG